MIVYQRCIEDVEFHGGIVELPKLQKVLQDISKKRDIDIILKPRSVYYVTPDLDITSDVTKLLNKAK